MSDVISNLSAQTVFRYVFFCLVLSCFVLPFPFLSYLFLSCFVLSSLILSCLVLSYLDKDEVNVWKPSRSEVRAAIGRRVQ